MLKINCNTLDTRSNIRLVVNYSSNREAALQRCFLGKAVLKICSRFTGEHPWKNAILIKLHSNFIEIALRHRCSPGGLSNTILPTESLLFALLLYCHICLSEQASNRLITFHISCNYFMNYSRQRSSCSWVFYSVYILKNLILKNHQGSSTCRL